MRVQGIPERLSTILAGVRHHKLGVPNVVQIDPSAGQVVQVAEHSAVIADGLTLRWSDRQAVPIRFEDAETGFSATGESE
jgi:hypothetical protein